MQPCLVCGDDFIPLRNDSKYCSTNCSKKAYKIRNSESVKNKNLEYMRSKRLAEKVSRKPIYRNCVVCSNSFLQNIYHPQQKCCSPKCNTKYYKTTNRDHVLALKRANNHRHADHLSEYNAHYKDQLRFSGNRLRALYRDNFTCQNCGYVGPITTDNRSEDVVVHHLDFSGSSSKPNNRINNLQTLCRPCHIRLHTHKL